MGKNCMGATRTRREVRNPRLTDEPRFLGGRNRRAGAWNRREYFHVQRSQRGSLEAAPLHRRGSADGGANVRHFLWPVGDDCAAGFLHGTAREPLVRWNRSLLPADTQSNERWRG